MTKDVQQAQDYTQDIFLKVFDQLEAFQHRSRFSTWLYAIAYNYCADQLRLGKRLSATSLDTAFHPEPADAPVDYLHEETMQVVKRAMATLSSQERSLLQSKYEQGLSIADIAQQEDLTPSTVKMRLMRSREKLRRLAQAQLQE